MTFPISRTPTSAGIWVRRLWLTILCLGAFHASVRYATNAQTTLQTFAIDEVFGVNHPDQILDFDIDPSVTFDPAEVYMTDASGSPVPFQILEGGRKVAVRTALAAGESRQWSLRSGTPPPQPTTDLRLTEHDEFVEVVNSRVGIRITKPALDLRFTRAPVQGIRHSDGTWSAEGPNLLSVNAKVMSVSLLESGPLKIVAVVDYVFDRPEEVVNGEVHPAGESFYRCTIEVQSGQPSILFEEFSDFDVSYSLNIHPGLEPTQGRYRGHHSTSVENGYEADGRQYRQWHDRLSLDAFVDLSFDESHTFRRLAVWDPWIYDSGWYWQWYNRDAPSTANVAGVFGGRASRALGARNSGVGLITEPVAVQDLESELGPDGNLHVIFESGRRLLYIRFNPNLEASAIEEIGRNLLYPDLMITESGVVGVVAYEPSEARFVLAEKRGNGGFVSEPVSFAPQAGLTVAPWPLFAYHASAGGNHFLLVRSELDGLQRGLLFSRREGESQFTLRDTIDGLDIGRQVRRPRFERMPDGRIVCLHSRGQYLELAFIAKGQTDFGGTQSQKLLFNTHRNVNYGASFDPATGDMFVADNQGALTLLEAGDSLAEIEFSNRIAKLYVGHSAQGPNRRSIASGPTGHLLACHGEEFFVFFEGRWARFEAADALGLAQPRVHWHAATGQFVLLGRYRGELAVFGWTPTAEAPVELSRISGTRQNGAILKMDAYRSTPDGRFYDQVRFQWGLYLGTKAEALADPNDVQFINRQMNLHGGISLNKIHRYQLAYSDPEGGYGGLFMDGDSVRKLINDLRADDSGAHGGGYHSYLWSAEPNARSLITMWADDTGGRTRQMADEVFSESGKILDILVNGNGTYDDLVHYWHGGLEMSRHGNTIYAILSDPLATEASRAKVKAVAALFGNILWDDDFAPLFSAHGLNLGTANMPVQQRGYRDFFAMLIAHHPTMVRRVAEIRDRTEGSIDSIVNEHGAEIGSTHYIGASFVPTLNAAMQLKQAGGVDFFAEKPELNLFAEFFMNFLTPIETRFGGRHRKLVAIGDASTEGSPIFGQLGTAFADADPALSARLMEAWRLNGKLHSGFHGTTLLSIDENLPMADLDLRSGSYPGYYSVLRNSAATPLETAVWLIHGDFYRDHRHEDHGSMVMYALGAPLSIDWGSLYSPQTAGAYMHSMVLPESTLSVGWADDSPPLRLDSPWRSSDEESFRAFELSGETQGRFEDGKGRVWRRNVVVTHPVPDYPVIVVRDRFEGFPNATPKIVSWNLMAEGEVTTPSGNVVPPLRTHADKPSASPVFGLSQGVNQLGFTGQWTIDWDLFLISDEAQEAVIGNWAHKWHPNTEMNQFQRAQERSFEERQHILRVRGTGEFTTVILPYRKGARRPDLTVSRDAGVIVIETDASSFRIGPDYYTYEDRDIRVVTAFGGGSVGDGGIQIAGGGAEVIQYSDQFRITLHGEPGERSIEVPASLQVADGLVEGLSGGLGLGRFRVNFEGGKPVTLVLK